MIVNEAQYRGKLYSFSRDFRHAAGRATVPLIASELHAVSHEVPVLFQRDGDDWTVVGLLDESCLRRPLFDGQGGWLGDYSPFELRIHPFRRTADGSAWEVAPEKVSEPPAPGRPFFAPDGTAAPEFARVRAMLADADRGGADLAEAATSLNDRALLAPLSLAFELDGLTPQLASLFCVDATALSRLRPVDLATLSHGCPSALDVAFASVYSLRLMRGHYATATAAELEERVATLIRASLESMSREAAAGTRPVDAGAAMPPAAMRGFGLDQSGGIDFSGVL